MLLTGAVLIVIVAGAWWLLGRGGGDPVVDSAADVVEAPGSPDAATGTTPLATAPVVMEPGTWLTPEGDPALGSVTAPVTIVEYSDYQCPNCREFAVEVLPWLRDTWVRRGFVRVIVRDFAMLGDESARAAEAAHCAGEQGHFWSYYEGLYKLQSGQNMGVFNDDALVALAQSLGLDAGSFDDCLQSGRGRARVDSSTRLAFGQGYEGTPTFIVNGRLVSGAVTIERWEELFKAYEEDMAQATSVAP
jgi:protein-disulfide isomerase